ncbi:heterokaryon incompatibility het-6 [Fusarium beomiforme]|uniref:Heterokaryon incompatibility het-6 n=1 Tax=Fusarium beomiforme TaxID=44412 RepID=A0A9P5DXF3_9HYPO|nr:heterokaryon incompatibility het-6 [Fusarium beomiforme]
MDSWHTAECKKPDITVFPGLGLPSCMNCGGMCPPRKVDNKCNNELKIPQAGKRSDMQLKWPPSMSYQDHAYQNDPDGSLHNALISELDKGWCDKGADQRMLPSSITNSSQPPASQGSKTSYETLDGTTIRILRLSKGRFGDCLHGNFETVSLEGENAEHEETQVVLSNEKKKNISYEAVSYTWAKGNGKREKDHVIFIGPRWDTLPITENCFDALQNCRLEGKDRCLWVDAICINQSNVSERTHQVGMMREIYSAASRVLIYLDVDDTESGTDITHDPQILSQNPYFSRIWVVQEIASAKQAVVLCVRQVMGWSFFHRNLQWLPDKKWMLHFGSPRQVDDAHGFLTLLEDTRECDASDPRDKIFALLGLWKEDMDPDYTLSPQEVYTGLAASLVTDRDKEVAGRLLDMASHGRSMPGLPSWVPDWSQKSQQIYQKRWKNFSRPGMLSKSKYGKFKVHRQTGSLCVLAAEMDVLASYFSCGFLPTINGMLTATSGYTQISLPREILYKCEPNDRIFILADYDFGLILRKRACPNIYTLVGLCEYSDLNNGPTTELDAIRYFQDWAWLLSVHGKEPWSEIGIWGKLHNCWRALRQQRKAERRSFFQRLIRKAHFLKQVQDLIQDTRYVLSKHGSNKRPIQAFFAQTWTSVCSDEPRMCTFFERRWERIYNKWKQTDKLLDLQLEERRSLIRALLPGYRSLAPLEDNSAPPALEQSMWLPVSLQWFKVHQKRNKDEFYTHYPLLAACASRNIPLPPLHLVDDFKRHIVLSLGLELESGLRQLQRVEREQLPQVLPSDETPMTSYSLESYKEFNFHTKEWKTFLYWLSKPTSPSYDRLKEWIREDLVLIWEPKSLAQGRLKTAHR